MARTVVGRERELAEVSRFVDSVATRFGVLLLSGPAGIGKTTLWDDAVAAARAKGYDVVVSRPTEVESGLAFAGLNDLLGELVDDHLDELPEPQRIALEAALLRIHATAPPQPLAVSMAVRQVIRQAAERRPLVIAIDDVQWLDEPSARVLDFVCRRLDEELVGVVAGQRTARDAEGDLPAGLRGVSPDRITRVGVGAMSVNAVDGLLRAHLGLKLPRPSLVRLHAVSGGNPFYAIELGRAIGGGKDAATLDALAVPPSLEGLVGDRLDNLGPEAEAVALHAAAASHPTTGLLAAAVGADAMRIGLAEAELAGVLAVDGDHVRFTHPLVAATTYARAPADRRGVVHLRLSDVVAGPQERAEHLARAATHPDEAVAAALEEAALVASGRGAPEAAAGLAERAADLTPDGNGPARRQRLSLAAQRHIAAGDVPRARALLDRLVEESAYPPERAAAMAELAHLLLVQAEWDQAGVLYREAASLVDDDPARRIPIELGLAGVAYVTWRDWRAGGGHGAQALRLAEELGDPVVLLGALGHAATWRGVLDEDWRALIVRADDLAEWGRDIPALEHPDLQFIRLLRDAGDFDGARERLDRRLEHAGGRGDWHSLPRLLLASASLQAWTGEFHLAAETLEAARTGVLQTGEGAWMDNVNVQALWQQVRRGEVDDARSTEDWVRARLEANPSLAHERWSTAVAAAELELSLGDAAGALSRIEPLLASAADDPLRASSVCDLVVLGVEVLVSLGRSGEALALFDRWSPRLRASGVRWIEAETERARAVLLAADGDVDAALVASERARERADGAGMPFLLARALLTAGEVRRRARQKARAREALEAAVELFTQLGARIWTERARSELARVAQRRPAGAPLTETERKVVELVTAGRTNREIADALFMSVHTVEAHLTRLFRALDVHTRTELASLALAGTDPRLGAGQDPEK